MSDHIKPRDEKDVCEAVSWALANDRTFEIVSGGSKRGFGAPVGADAILDLSGFTGITLYEPEELILTAAAGTPLSEISAELAKHGQELVFEPVDYGPLYGGDSGSGTLGGTLAGNISGSRRIRAGAARDHFLGVKAVSGRGEAFKSGGRVVKNVTGYDLCKGLAGSWGTLAVMTQVTVKVLPAGEECRTILLDGLGDESAIRAMSIAMGSAYEISGAAHLPAGIFRESDLDVGLPADSALTALRIEGFGPSVSYRAAQLGTLLSGFGTCRIFETGAAKRLWNDISSASYFTANAVKPLWRISVPAMSGASVAHEILEKIDARCFYDWAGGLIWLECADPDNAHEGKVRTALAGCGGHATLVRAATNLRNTVPVFHPQPGPLYELTKRLKDGFDPKGVLNPGRMYRGV